MRSQRLARAEPDDEIPEGGKDLLFTGDEPGLKEALERLTDPADMQINPHIAGRLRVLRDGDLVYLVGPIAGTVTKCFGTSQ